MTNELEDLMQQPGMSIVITMPTSLEKNYKVSYIPFFLNHVTLNILDVMLILVGH